MNLILTKDLEIVRSVLADDRLLKSAGSDKDSSSFEVLPYFEYLMIENDSKLIGCFQLKPVTNQVIETHINLRSEYWGKEDLGYIACKEMFGWIVSNKKQRILYTDVPSTCTEVQNLLARLGCKVSGLIKDGVVYNGKIQDLLLYTINLYE